MHTEPKAPKSTRGGYELDAFSKVSRRALGLRSAKQAKTAANRRDRRQGRRELDAHRR